MKRILIPFCAFLLFSCSETKDNEKADNPKENVSESADTISSEVVPVEESVQIAESVEYYGSYFKVEYPGNFIASPLEPKDTYPESDKEFVETDEAYFSSEDGSIEFYVYSPQWGGTSSYRKPKINESIESTKSSEEESDLGVTTTTWKEFKDNNDSYFRACVIEETENTSKIFGIKYKDQATYDKFKESYLAFKKSLEQYAD